jgi:hypothetical protein
MKMSLVLLLSSVVLPLVNGVTSCKLFHKKDKWHNWSKLYSSWIKLTLITMFKSSFLYIKRNKIQLWKLVCFIMQHKWNSTTTYPNIVKKKLVLQRKYPTLCIISLYIMYVTTFYIKIIFHFPKKNNFMLVTPRLKGIKGCYISRNIFFHGGFPDCILCKYVIVM